MKIDEVNIEVRRDMVLVNLLVRRHVTKCVLFPWTAHTDMFTIIFNAPISVLAPPLLSKSTNRTLQKLSSLNQLTLWAPITNQNRRLGSTLTCCSELRQLGARLSSSSKWTKRGVPTLVLWFSFFYLLINVMSIKFK